MMIEAPDHSIIRRKSPRADLLAFEIRARITKPDIEWMACISNKEMKEHGEIDMLIIMSNYDGADISAIFDGYAIGIEASSIAHVRRYFVVGAPQFAETMIKLSGFLMPVETKTFALSQEQEAWASLENGRTSAM